MKTALIAGATGLIGRSLIQLLLESNEYQNVIALVRKPSLAPHPKLDEQIIDFNQLKEFSVEGNADDVYCCLGTTIKTAGSQEAFSKVDYSYVLELAKWAHKNMCRHFSVVSSVGAKVNTSNFYLRTKGQMEQAISGLTIPSVQIFRPSLLLGQRNEFRLAEKVSEKVMLLFNPLLKGRLRKYRAIQASDVAKAMYNQAQNNRIGIKVFEGAEIR
ncbi:MAG: oxidoreductase [Bacteroidales bacterium]|nr:oxidoreductase [Bacteroidales bacterium]